MIGVTADRVLGLVLLAAVLPAAAALGGSPPATGPGARAFLKCYACHSLDSAEARLPGPTLHHVLGRVAGSLPGYEYSPAMVEAGRARGLVWTEGTLDRFLADPEGFLPGTLMGFPGLSDPTERRALIDYLRQAAR